MTRKDVLLLVVIAALFGASFLLGRIAAPVTGPLPVSAGRVAFGALVPIAVLAWRHRLHELFSVTPRQARDLLVMGVLLAALPFTLFAVAQVYITASLTAVLNAATPMWGIIVAAIWLGQPITLRRLSGAALGAVGVALVVGLGPLPTDPLTLAAAGACLLAALSYALGSTWTARRLTDVTPTALAGGQQLVAAMLLVLPGAVMLSASAPQAGADPDAFAGALAAIVALGFVCTGFAFFLWFALLRRIGPVAAVTVTLLAPVFGVAWGAVFLGEAVTPGLVVGAATVLAGVLLITGLPARTPARGNRPRQAPASSVPS